MDEMANSEILHAEQTPTVVFYSKVGAELAKIVFRNQKMTPP